MKSNLSAKQNDLIYQISNSILRVSNLNTILSKAAKEMIVAMNAVVVSIALYDKNFDVLVVKIAKHRNGYDRKPQRRVFKIGEGAAGLAASSKKIINIPNVDNSPIFIGKCRSSAKSLICIPMIFRNELVGVLNVSDRKERKFTKQDEEFLTILATMIGAAIENSRLLDDIKEENDLLNSIIENTGEGVLVTDANGKVISINRYFERYMGVNEKEIFNKNGLSLAEKVGADSYIKKVQKLVRRNKINKSIYDEVTFAIPNGEKTWYGTTASFIKGMDNKLKNIVIVARDITKEKSLLQAKNDLITTATHELRTPVTAIKGYLSMLENGDAGKVSRKQKIFLKQAASATDRLVNLIEDLLCTQKIDEKKIKTEKKTFNIDEVVLTSINNLSSKAAQKKVIIKYKSVPMCANGDAVRTKHILENIIDNAIKYTKNNGTILISSQRQDREILVSVKDSGVGIPQKYHKKIFDKFTRINNPLSVKAGGTGLGLYITKKLIEKQGGRIWLESAPNAGTTFYFTVPASTTINK
jgi:PAS domain S-box-containing protein